MCHIRAGGFLLVILACLAVSMRSAEAQTGSNIEQTFANSLTTVPPVARTATAALVGQGE